MEQLVNEAPVVQVDEVAARDDAVYKPLEERVRKGDLDALRARWEFGRALLWERGDRERLPKGRLAHIANALAISEAELRNRMQFARERATEEDVRSAFEEYGSWSAICARGMGERGTLTPLPPEHSQGVPVAELVPITELRAHPLNYRGHPPEQIAHLVRSIKEFGFVRNIVTTRDGTTLTGHGTILAGHGAWLAAKELGYTHVPAVRLDLDPFSVQALKLLAGDNEISNTADDHDRKKLDMLKRIKDAGALEGTGYNAEQIAADLVFKCSPRDEIPDMNAARIWLGMPEHEYGPENFKLVLGFYTEDDRVRVMETLNVRPRKKTGKTWSAFYPDRPKGSLSDLAWVEKDDEAVEEAPAPPPAEEAAAA